MAVSGQIVKEEYLLLYSFLLGASLTLVYDLFRVLRRLFPHGKWWIAVQDLCFWIFSAGCVFLMIYKVNDGSLRAFALLGLTVGALLYHRLLSVWVVKLLHLILDRCLRIVRFPFSCLKKRLEPMVRKGKIFVKGKLKKT